MYAPGIVKNRYIFHISNHSSTAPSGEIDYLEVKFR